jgi:glutaredoxin 3
MARDGLGRGHGEQVAAALVEDEVEPEEGLEAPAEAAARAPNALGDRAQLAALRGIHVQDAVGLAEAQGAQNHALDLHRARHETPAIFSEVMAKITVYSTEPCSFCERAKQLLRIRKLDFDEINLAKDPAGRAQLVEETGMLSFPQIVVGEVLVGGFQQLVQADQSGRLAELTAQAA